MLTLKSCITTYLIGLHQLHFVLYLPIETKLEETDLYWFDLNHRAVEYEINKVTLLYTIPYLLNSQRQVHNHIAARRSTNNNKMNHIEWIIDRDSLLINTTLTQFQHVKSLLIYYNIKVRNQRNCIDILIDLNLFRKLI